MKNLNSFRTWKTINEKLDEDIFDMADLKIWSPEQKDMARK